MNNAKRDEQMRQWVKAAPSEDALDYEDVLMWGVCFNLDSIDPPQALFASEAEANAYATLFDRAEWHVGPYVLREMLGRNSADFPKE